jgi:hypothetical protein
VKARSDERPELVEVEGAEEEQRAVASDLQVRHEVLEQTGEIEALLFGGKCSKKRLLKKVEDGRVRKEIAKEESSEKDPEAAEESCFELFQVLPKTHERA